VGEPWLLGFNTTLPLCNSVLMRKAVANAVDRAQVALADKNHMPTSAVSQKFDPRVSR
jgi:hypothetical protein